MEQILIFGSRGFLGREMSKILSVENSVTLVSGLAKRELVIGSKDATRSRIYPMSESSLDKMIAEINPSIVINCSGLIGDKSCDENPAEANWANSVFVGTLARILNNTNSTLVHFSSDAVFGDELIDRIETDIPNPSTIYGKTKLLGEQYALGIYKRTLVVRTNFYGHSGILSRGIFDFFYHNLKKNVKIQGYSDVIFNPLLISEIPRAILRAKEVGMFGILHLCGSDFLSKYKFGCMVASSISCDTNLIGRSLFKDTAKSDSRRLMYLNSTRKDSLGLEFMRVSEGIKESVHAAEEGSNEHF